MKSVCNKRFLFIAVLVAGILAAGSAMGATVRELTVSDSAYRSGITITPAVLPLDLSVVASPDLTSKDISGVTAKLSSSDTGLEVTVSQTTVTLNSAALKDGKTNLTIIASVDNTARSMDIPITVNAAAKPKLDEIAEVRITLDETTLPQTVALSSTPKGAVNATALAGPAGSAKLDALSCAWKGLKISASGSNITVSKYSSPATAVPVTGTFQVSADITVGTTVTNNVAQSFKVTLLPKSTPTILTFPPLKLTAGEIVNKIIRAGTTGGTIALSGVVPASWNGLSLAVSADVIKVSGIPIEAGSRKFTITGTSGAAKATGELTITVAADPTAPAPVNELGAPSAWKKERANNNYILDIPITKKFIDRFDSNKDGKLTTVELAEVLPAVTAPNASLTDVQWSVSGNTLYIDLEFAPKKGHNHDWYKNLFLKDITFIGSNKAAARYTFDGGIELEKIANSHKGGGRSGGGGGCDTGASALVLSLLAPVILRARKKR
ncbi:MAG: SYNERG-CTERM sorting domain-containing protein [Synergistaceae bacterium]|nr:SYNERG-CTERM sorting domain-containing protein [Synergistaceae bacterium]